jgi:hypothetical protein
MVGRWVAPVPRAAGRPLVTDPSPDFRRCSWTTIQSRTGARAASPRRVRPWVVCRILSDNFVIAPADIFVHITRRMASRYSAVKRRRLGRSTTSGSGGAEVCKVRRCQAATGADCNAGAQRLVPLSYGFTLLGRGSPSCPPTTQAPPIENTVACEGGRLRRVAHERKGGPR